MPIIISPTIQIPDDEIDESFIRSSGPGGQNVNKSSTAVQLRFNVRSTAALPEDVRQRLLRLTSSSLTNDGELIITAREFRSQDQNRSAARERLRELILRAMIRPKKRNLMPYANNIKDSMMLGNNLRL